MGNIRIAHWLAVLLAALVAGCGTGAEPLPLAGGMGGSTTSSGSNNTASSSGADNSLDASGVAGVSEQLNEPAGANSNASPDASTQAGPPLPPPPLPSLPAASRLYMRYLPDGGYKLSDGIPQPLSMRPLIITDIQNVAAAGFKRYATIHQLGMARSQAEAEAYFAPIVAQAEASGVKFIPGFWLLNVIDATFGVSFEPPWNMPNTLASKQNHPMNPSGLGQQAFWDNFVVVVRNLARGAHTDQVYIDCEDVFWRHQDNAFWTDENIAAVRPMLRAALAQLRSEGIFILVHQPRPQPGPVNIYRIATGLFAPDDADDALAHVEHTALMPGQRIVPGTVLTPAQVENMYTSNGFRAAQVRFGFTQYSDPFSGVFGYLPAEFISMLESNPAIADRAWYFAGDHLSADHAAVFAALGPPALP